MEGEDVPIEPSRMYVLIACGAKDSNGPPFLFSDILGFVRGYEKYFHVGGEFLTAIDPAEWVKLNEKDLLFGRGVDDEFEREVVLSKFDAEHRKDIYKVTGSDQLAPRVRRWTRETAKKAKPFDRVNIILVAHGYQANSAIELRDMDIHPQDIAAWAKKFDAETQVGRFLTPFSSRVMIVRS